MSRDYEDWRRIEVMDDAMAEVLRRKTPAERIAIGFGHSVQKRFAQEVGRRCRRIRLRSWVSIGV